MREEGEGIGLMIKVVEESGTSLDPLHHTKPDLSIRNAAVRGGAEF